MDIEALQRWIDRYVAAWRSNDPVAVGELFSEDARYFTHPFRPPWEGREDIVRHWTEHPDEAGSWTCDYRALAVTDPVGVIHGHTAYLRPDGSEETRYANVFVARFDPEGRCAEFTEFFMRPDPPAPTG